MSDLMLFAVLEMPYEMAMESEISRIQFYGRVQQAVERIRQQEDELAAKQAKIDAMMLEYCPEEMTKEQVEEWGKHQVPAPENLQLSSTLADVNTFGDGRGWLNWPGGDMPVAEDISVDVLLQNGRQFMDYSASEYRWNHENNDQDIIAYRVVK